MATERPPGAQVRLTRLIAAPPDVVFEVWTRPEHLTEWWGPTGFSLPSCELDFRVGGAFCYRMRGPAGEDHWLRGAFQQIVEPERIAFTFAWGDAARATGPVTLVTVTFEAHDGKTRVTLQQTGFESESAARAHEGGWSTQFDRLAAFAAEAAHNKTAHNKRSTAMTPKNTICLWFDKDAEEAARFYAATFPNSKVTAVRKAPGDFPSGKQNDVLTVEFTVFGIPCIGINGGPHFKQSEAFSFQIATDNQEETDRYWNAIVGNGGKESECGWCKDRWGVSWQITPRALTDAMAAGGAEAKRAFDAMMKMQKIDVATIEAARRG